MKRLKDGRFVEKRIRIPKTALRSIVLDVKTKNHLTWEGLAKILGVCAQTIRVDWLIKGNSIPKSAFEKLLALDKNLKMGTIKGKVETIENPYWGQQKGGNVRKSRVDGRIVLPNINSKEFAEFYGIMLGDGCIYSNLNGFCITGNSITDKTYYEMYLKKLIRDLFGIRPKISRSKYGNILRCYAYSQKISKFLSKQGFPIGKKKLGKPHIPEFIMADNSLLTACIRGLQDTDGSVCAHPHSKIMVQISITVPRLLDSVDISLKKLGIAGGKYNKGINIYGKNKVERYFGIVGSSNPKHQFKYESFLKTGKVPSNEETEGFLRKRITL